MIKLICLHFIADFILQSREMGKKKSQKFNWLVKHLCIQFLIFYPFTSLQFSFVNALIHGIIDWYIWKAYKYSVVKRFPLEKYTFYVDFKYWEDHLFYTTIGFDQMLHTATLISLYQLGL